MNTMKKTGIALIIIGIALSVFTAFTYFTREKVVDIGSIKITANKPHNISWSPFVGIIVLAAGAVIYFIPQKK